MRPPRTRCSRRPSSTGAALGALATPQASGFRVRSPALMNNGFFPNWTQWGLNGVNRLGGISQPGASLLRPVLFDDQRAVLGLDPFGHLLDGPHFRPGAHSRAHGPFPSQYRPPSPPPVPVPEPGPPQRSGRRSQYRSLRQWPPGPQTRFVRQTMATWSARSALAAATGKASGDLNGVAALEPVVHKLP